MLSILIVDDDAKAGGKAVMLRDNAEMAGRLFDVAVNVQIAKSYEDAELAILRHYDMAMFDLRLDASNENDERGLQLFSKYRYDQPMSKVILYSGTSEGGIIHDGISCLEANIAKEEMIEFINSHRGNPDIVDAPKTEESGEPMAKGSVLKYIKDASVIMFIIGLVFAAGMANNKIETVSKSMDSHCATQSAKEEKTDQVINDLKTQTAVLAASVQELTKSIDQMNRFLRYQPPTK
jgi:hypothetical protein